MEYLCYAMINILLLQGGDQLLDSESRSPHWKVNELLNSFFFILPTTWPANKCPQISISEKMLSWIIQYFIDLNLSGTLNII